MQKAILGAILLISSCEGVIAQDAAQGEKVFNRCKACHQIGEGAKNRAGPELNGIVGRQAGTAVGFAYSDAMRNSNLTWNEATLAEFLRNPKQKVPGSKMASISLPQPQDIADVIAYLKQFDATGE